jgi:hypothetical protein
MNSCSLNGEAYCLECGFLNTDINEYQVSTLFEMVVWLCSLLILRSRILLHRKMHLSENLSKSGRWCFMIEEVPSACNDDR